MCGNYLEMAIKEKMKNYFENDDLYNIYGIKRFQILDIMESREGIVNHDYVHKYHVLVKHKELCGWENCSAFTIFSYENWELGDPMFDGMARLDDGEFIEHSISFGSFTREMADEWLENVSAKMGVA